MSKEPAHHHEIKKLNRVAGQIEGIRKMIDEGRYCPDIITQLRAARAAIRNLEASILETHLHHCVSDAMLSGNRKKAAEKIEELKDMFKRFDQ
jgi:DNA-binding FrmR family transcriptional regulator